MQTWEWWMKSNYTSADIKDLLQKVADAITQENLDRAQEYGPMAMINGHSFVTRFRHWIGSHANAPRSPSYVCEQISYLHFIGVSGPMTPWATNFTKMIWYSKHHVWTLASWLSLSLCNRQTCQMHQMDYCQDHQSMQPNDTDRQNEDQNQDSMHS